MGVPRSVALALLLGGVPAAVGAAMPPAATLPCPGGDAVPAASLVPPSLLGGEDYTVDRCARLVGHRARFVLRPTAPLLDSPLEPPVLEIDGIDRLEQRVAEMAALRQLRAIDRTSAAGGTAWASLRQTGTAVGEVVTRPVESVIGLPAGALRFVGRRAEELGRQAANAGERAGEAITDAPEHAGPMLRPEPEADPIPDAEPWWRTGGGLALRLGKRWLGYNAARRDLSERLGIDPYTGNPWLDAEMDRLAWASLAGRRGIGLGLGQIGGIAGTALSGTGRLHRMVWSRSPEEVTAWNRVRLAPLRCTEEARDEFFDNARFSPTLQTQATDALLVLAPQDGCDLLLGLAARVDRDVDARYLVDALQLLAAAGPRFPVRFEAFGALWGLRDGDEALWLALPVDLLRWTPGTAAAFESPALHASMHKRLVLGRTASPQARAALLAAGWTVIEDAMGPAREQAGPPATPPP